MLPRPAVFTRHIICRYPINYFFTDSKPTEPVSTVTAEILQPQSATQSSSSLRYFSVFSFSVLGRHREAWAWLGCALKESCIARGIFARTEDTSGGKSGGTFPLPCQPPHRLGSGEADLEPGSRHLRCFGRHHGWARKM